MQIFQPRVSFESRRNNIGFSRHQEIFRIEKGFDLAMLETRIIAPANFFCGPLILAPEMQPATLTRAPFQRTEFELLARSELRFVKF